ncbi:MAG: two-component regulator propeller domain-containing protein, partial [Bacteroidota bacterium]
MTSLLLLFYFNCLNAQDGIFQIERTTAIYGLPNGYIKTIAEDSYGYLWFGTREGVFQYDGYEFKAYRHDLFDENSLSHPAVNAIVEDHKNRLW